MSKSKDFKAATYDRLTKLTIKRLETIQIAVNELNELQTPITQVQLRKLSSYAVEVKKKCADFELNLQRALDSSSADELDDAVLSKQQDIVNNLQAEICATIEVLTPPDPQTPSAASDFSQSFHTPQSQVRLPQLDLQQFSGDLSNWTAFINLFDTTIHRNATLNSVIKFQYLLSVLQNEPLNLIKGLALTSANYTVAYNLLRERYHNPRRLISIHLNQLLDLPNITGSSTKGLRHFVNLFTEHSQALKALDCDITTASNPLLSALILRKMDNDLRKRLESHRSSRSDDETAHSLPEVKDIISFLNTECVQVEDANIHNTQGTNKSSFSQNTRSGVPSNKKVSFSHRDVTLVTTQIAPSRSTTSTAPCFCCNQKGHKVYSCTLFKDKTPQDRFNLVKKHGRCTSCLGNHDFKGCQSQVTCLQCQRRHHTLLHFPNSIPTAPLDNQHQYNKAPVSNQSKTNIDLAPASNSSRDVSPTSVAMTSQDSPLPHTDSTVLLGTALVKLTTPEGNSHVFRALIDSASMSDLISERAAQLLGTQRHKSAVMLSGLSQNMTANKGQVFVNIETLSGFVLAHHQSMVVVDKLTLDLPRTQISTEVLRRTQRYILADPSFHLPGPIDVVIGGAYFAQLLTKNIFSLGQNMPYVVGTHFGYIVMGSAPCVSPVAPDLSSNTTVSMLTTTDSDLHSSIQRFWHQEEPPVFHKKTEEEKTCDNHFTNTHYREADGRYVVRLPFKNNKSDLGTSHSNAERRFHALERKLAKNAEFCTLYHDFMKEYISLGHMTVCHEPDLTKPHFYLPHHGVMKTSSSTTKLRTVFDASSKTSTGLSLNDVLLTGRKLQTDITDILMHFRSHHYVISCDIRKMYRQINIHPDDKPFQLVLWREDMNHPIQTFTLNTVTYGLNSSPYLAIKTLHQLADDEGAAFPAAAHVLRTQTYVDDVITGANTEQEAVSLKNQLTCLLSKGGFELRKWVSNSPRVLSQLPEDHLETPVFLQQSNQPQFTILGLHWSPITDCFTYNLNFPMTSSPTKRSVLSVIAQIYDPCGFLAPVITIAKCFMQLLWTAGLTWDEPLPLELAEKWQKFVSDIAHLSEISIPRSFEFSQSHTIELHGFSDASESAISAVVYFRCQTSSQEIVVRPVIAKTRVAPLKRVTIPRLELCAAHLLAQLVHHCQSIFKEQLYDENIFLWTDSSVALTWLKTPPYRLKTYVANRVSQAQELVRPEVWRHISTTDNPADCASRGIPASQLVDHPLWWSGPTWLKLPKQSWPNSNVAPVDLDSTEEVKQTPLTVLTTTKDEEWSLLTRFSSWETLQRVTAWILRFVNNCRSKERRSGLLSLAELKSAQLKIFSTVQQTTFPEEIALLQKNRECSTRIQRLKPFIRDDGMLCVGGRLNLTSLLQDVRNPVLLPKSHKVVELLIDHYHVTHLHAGPQLTQALLARHVWILNARSIIRSRIFKCVTCFKNKPKNKTPMMGELPLARVTPARPFLSSGIDYAGPFDSKILNLKAIRSIKVYLCIFVCMVTKAVHIEVVHDLTTDAFIAALTRFVSRRGVCSDIYSDCGTNFVGASSALRKITNSLFSTKSKENIHCFSNSRGIKFHFNPPAAPHQGGLWESAVKSAKHHLRRTMGATVLTLPELITLTTQVEAMLNSRPLTPLSSDPADLSALTPGHFLIGAPLAAVPESDLLITPQNRLKQWQLVQAFQQHIWRRWHLEYLHTLHQRMKWTHSSVNLKIGDLVLVHTPSAPLSWPLARITAVYPGADGIVRVVDLKTTSGILTRPATKVFPLPVE